MIKPAFVINVKARGLLLVKRAQTHEAAAPALKSDNLLNYGCQRSLSTDTLDRLLSEHGRTGLLPIPRSRQGRKAVWPAPDALRPQGGPQPGSEVSSHNCDSACWQRIGPMVDA